MVVYLSANWADEMVTRTLWLEPDSVGYAQFWYCLTHDDGGPPVPNKGVPEPNYQLRCATSRPSLPVMRVRAGFAILV